MIDPSSEIFSSNDIANKILRLNSQKPSYLLVYLDLITKKVNLTKRKCAEEVTEVLVDKFCDTGFRMSPYEAVNNKINHKITALSRQLII